MVLRIAWCCIVILSSLLPAVAQTPDSVCVLNRRGAELLGRGKYKEVRKVFLHGIDICPAGDTKVTTILKRTKNNRNSLGWLRLFFVLKQGKLSTGFLLSLSL